MSGRADIVELAAEIKTYIEAEKQNADIGKPGQSEEDASARIVTVLYLLEGEDWSQTQMFYPVGNYDPGYVFWTSGANR